MTHVNEFSEMLNKTMADVSVTKDKHDFCAEDMKKLRLLLFTDCNRNCEGCCNNDFDLNALKVETDFRQYDKIFLTGGEPMIAPAIVINTIENGTTRYKLLINTVLCYRICPATGYYRNIR